MSYPESVADRIPISLDFGSTYVNMKWLEALDPPELPYEISFTSRVWDWQVVPYIDMNTDYMAKPTDDSFEYFGSWSHTQAPFPSPCQSVEDDTAILTACDSFKWFAVMALLDPGAESTWRRKSNFLDNSEMACWRCRSERVKCSQHLGKGNMPRDAISSGPDVVWLLHILLHEQDQVLDAICTRSPMKSTENDPVRLDLPLLHAAQACFSVVPKISPFIVLAGGVRHHDRCDSSRVEYGMTGAPDVAPHVLNLGTMKALDHPASPEDLTPFRELSRWDGRQIRNAFQVARSLTYCYSDDRKHEGPPRLRVEHFKTIQGVTEDLLDQGSSTPNLDVATGHFAIHTIQASLSLWAKRLWVFPELLDSDGAPTNGLNDDDGINPYTMAPSSAWFEPTCRLTSTARWWTFLRLCTMVQNIHHRVSNAISWAQGGMFRQLLVTVQ